MKEASRWFHAHKGPPYVCVGGAEDIEDIRPLAIIQDCVVIETRHRPSVCPYKPINFRTVEVEGMHGKVSEAVVLGPLTQATQELADLLPHERFVVMVSTDGFVIGHPIEHKIDEVHPNLMELTVLAIGFAPTQLDAVREAIKYVKKHMRRA